MKHKQKLVISIIIIFILIIILVLLYYKHKKIDNYENNKTLKENLKIPRKIWIFWHEELEKSPNIIQFCYKIITRQCPDYEINFLNLKNYKKFVDDNRINKIIDNPNINIIYKSDLIRLYLIYRFGGIYLDASIILLKSLDWIYEYTENYDVIMFKNNHHSNNSEKPVLENWFIAGKPNNDFIHKTLEMLLFILNTNDLEKEVMKIKQDNSINLQNFGNHGVYHLTYFIIIYQLQKNNYTNIKYLECHKDTYECSFMYNINLVKQLYDKPINDDEYDKIVKNSKLIKLTSNDRNYIKDFSITKNSFMDKMINKLFSTSCSKVNNCLL
jgi:hypothetical protein